MGRKSSIEDLPPEVKALVDAQIRAGTYTVDGLVVIIKDAGEERSRSAVGRYVKNKKQTMELYDQAQDMAKSLALQFKEDPDGNVARMLGQVLRGITFSTMQTLAEDGGKVKPNELMLLSAAIKNLAGADKITLDQVQRIQKLAKEEAAADVAKVAKRSGISQEIVDKMTLAITSGQVP